MEHLVHGYVITRRANDYYKIEQFRNVYQFTWRHRDSLHQRLTGSTRLLVYHGKVLRHSRRVHQLLRHLELLLVLLEANKSSIKITDRFVVE